jgi:hypothetical protein
MRLEALVDRTQPPGLQARSLTACLHARLRDELQKQR